MMKILVVFTGGTIGSRVKNGIADVDTSLGYELINLYRAGSEDCDKTEFVCVNPLNILSENLTCDTLSQLCNYMLSIDYTCFDGVIVTHGSDTLAYTSAMLGLLLSWVSVPIVLTAADYVISLPYSNGLVNFWAAVDFIRGFSEGCHSNCGVFTVWKNSSDAEPCVYISTRLNEADGYADSFSSWGGVPFGVINGHTFVRNDNAVNPVFTESNSMFSFLQNQRITLSNKVFMLQSYPGLAFSSVSIDGMRAILLRLYHSATACTEGENTDFSRFAEKCAKNKVQIFVSSAKMTQYSYESYRKMLDKNQIPLYNIGMCAAYAKVMLMMSLDEAVIGEISESNIFYEILPNKEMERNKF
ncbi:MAG: asparaginase domain-containing protein [Lachnospiraceae bacterium]|nr:asparaginase domain-containing protein [Lachnospiraceae bacterium]